MLFKRSEYRFPIKHARMLEQKCSKMNVKDLIEIDPEKMSGAPVFTGTRVPINHLFDYLTAGDSLDIFLADFPTVKREQALGVIELMRERILTEYETVA